MRKRTLLVVAVLMLAVAWCVNAYAADGSASGWRNFWGAIGGFFYNALPWHWGNWIHKSA